MNESTADTKKASGAITLWGVLTIVLGVFAMGAPLVTGLALALMIGISLVAIRLIFSGMTMMTLGAVGREVSNQL